MKPIHKPIHFLPFAALLLPLAAHAQPSASALLRAMRKAEMTAHYSGVATLTRAGLPPMTMRVVRDGAKRRIEWLSPPVMRGDVLVDNGQTVLRYEKSENTVFQVRSSARSDARAGSAATPPSTARVSGSTQVAGRAAWVVIVPTRNGSRRVYVDKATRVRLRAEVLSVNGQRAEVVGLQSVAFGTQSASAFAFAPPISAQLIKTDGALYARLAPARKAASWLRSPAYLPRGFGFESAVVDPKGEAWLRYSNGSQRFSVFQQRAAVPDAEPRKVGSDWLARKNGSRFAIVGAPGDEGKRIAASLK